MSLINNAQRAKLLANGRARIRALYAGNGIDLDPVVKLYTPDAGCVWLLSELDPADPDRAFGLCDLGLGYPELGHVLLSELRTARGPCQLPIERDRTFTSEHSLFGYADIARQHRRILT